MALVIVIFCSEKRALAEDQACNAGLLSLNSGRNLISDIDILIQDRLKVQILCVCLRLDTGEGHAERNKFLAAKRFFYIYILRLAAVAFIVIGNGIFRKSFMGGYCIGLALNVIIALRFLLELETIKNSPLEI